MNRGADLAGAGWAPGSTPPPVKSPRDARRRSGEAQENGPNDPKEIRTAVVDAQRILDGLMGPPARGPARTRSGPTGLARRGCTQVWNRCRLRRLRLPKRRANRRRADPVRLLNPSKHPLHKALLAPTASEARGWLVSMCSNKNWAKSRSPTVDSRSRVFAHQMDLRVCPTTIDPLRRFPHPPYRLPARGPLSGRLLNTTALDRLGVAP